MQFLADVCLECEVCGGKWFKQEVLDVQYKGKSIYDILELSVEEVLEFFEEEKDVVSKLQLFYDVGLGYVYLGQFLSIFFGGEVQWVKLAFFLMWEWANEYILFIFDEFIIGLYFYDICKLLDVMNVFVENGYIVMVVEYNMEVIKNVDWVVDLGFGGGKEGGDLVFQGMFEELVEVEALYIGQFLKFKLEV